MHGIFGVWSENVAILVDIIENSEYSVDIETQYEQKDMIPRLLQLPKKKSFLLFGARNIGKSTLLAQRFSGEHTITFDLLEQEQVDRFTKPGELYNVVKAPPPQITHIIIDEIQKAPALLDDVQRLMKDKSKYFIMTGSSARKLKHGRANLLAGRAYVYHLYPFSFLEIGDPFDLTHALQWGTLPEIFDCQNNQERQQFLMSYAHTYLKEEIWGEHFIRQLDPFRKFLEVAAQCNGTIVNYSNIAKDVGVDDKTVRSYFSILEDTLIGFFLEPYSQSIRKRQTEKPKFYFFDTGVTRALARSLSIPLQPQTHAYGNAFEHYIITECIRLASYYKPEYQFSYIKTPADVEIDLIIDRPGQKTLLVEIKSATEVSSDKLGAFSRLSKDFPNSEAICLSNEKYAKKIRHITVFPWRIGLQEIFL